MNDHKQLKPDRISLRQSVSESVTRSPSEDSIAGYSETVTFSRSEGRSHSHTWGDAEPGHGRKASSSFAHNSRSPGLEQLCKSLFKMTPMILRQLANRTPYAESFRHQSLREMANRLADAFDYLNERISD